MLRAAGSSSSTARDSTVCLVADCMSTSGDSPVTVIDSSSVPTFSSALIVAVKSVVSTMPSRFTVPKPASANVTVYVPGLRLTILYWPVPSVTATRVFSISAGLDASTVTPGMICPDVSFTVPAIDAPVWAYTAAETITVHRRTNTAHRLNARI